MTSTPSDDAIIWALDEILRRQACRRRERGVLTDRETLLELFVQNAFRANGQAAYVRKHRGKDTVSGRMADIICHMARSVDVRLIRYR